MVQILVRALPWLGGAARINRGPLWCDRPWTHAERGLFLHALQRAARHHRWWYVRGAFEWPENPDVRVLLLENGWRPVQDGTAWGSHQLSLAPDVAVLRQGLTGKWRNRLVKGERQESIVQVGVNGKRWQQLLQYYRIFQQEKGFVGIATPLLERLPRQQGKFWRLDLLSAQARTAPDQSIALLLSLHHGAVATYLIGLTTAEGRSLQANYVLLWQAILLAKAQGAAWFDLGGVNAETPEGIVHFKSGVGGTPYQLVGEWSWHPFSYRRAVGCNCPT
ncbi:MAG: peptidoglycan bridge formation glycyltransferase FemA/FemB family protein [Magnetococcus sp. MYC-9]